MHTYICKYDYLSKTLGHSDTVTEQHLAIKILLEESSLPPCDKFSSVFH